MKKKAQWPEKIELLALDFDGVFTDDKVHVTQDGIEFVTCDRRDGLGLGLLRSFGVRMVVFSTEANPVVRARCDKLKLECFSSCHDKKTLLLEFAVGNKISLENTVFVGNDVNDAEAMRCSGFSVAPKNAHEKIKKLASHVLKRSGGDGALRELSEIILKKYYNWDWTYRAAG